ncbi:MAG: FHA domain-containing protein, partial [Anaerolineales bacterium]|nr:FHA domain-containing protein [Anaerolineales bacterium]
ENLASASGGTFINVATQPIGNAHYQPMLQPLRQWQATGSLHTLRGDQRGQLQLTLDGKNVRHDITFTAPGDFPQPPTLTYSNKAAKECEIGTICSFTYTLNDPHQQIDHLAVQAYLANNSPVLGVPLTLGDDSHIPRPTESTFTLDIWPTDRLPIDQTYTLHLEAIPTNPTKALLRDDNATFSLKKPPLPLKIYVKSQETKTTTQAWCDALPKEGFWQQTKVCSLFQNQKPITQTLTHTENNIRLDIAIENGEAHKDEWKSIDVYVVQRRWRWFRLRQEGFEYDCPLPLPAGATNGTQTTQNDGKEPCVVIVATDWQTATLTIPHRLEPRTTWLTLQARDGERRPLMPPVNLPSVREVNLLGRIAETISNFWQDLALWFGLLLLALALLLVWWLITLLRRPVPTEDTNRIDSDALPFTKVLLTVCSSPDASMLDKVLIVGSSAISIGRESCTLNIPGDGYLSRRHAEISFDEKKGYSIRDLGSDHGTYIRIQDREPERVSTTGSTSLDIKAGSEIRAGDTILRIESKPVE